MIFDIGWLPALHVIGIILWMGGLFVLTRHAGQNAQLAAGDPAREAFSVYERKSYYMGVLPGFLLTLVTGLWMLFEAPAQFLEADGPWGATFHIKLTLVVVLIAADQFFHFKMRKLHADGTGSKGAFMAAHGIVGLCFIAIVLLMKVRFMT